MFDVDNHVESIDLSLSGNDLTLAVGRAGIAGTLSDTVTLPVGSGGTGDDAYDWATEGNTDLIPNNKLDGLLSQIMAGTNITIDDTTSGQITIAASGGGTGDDAYDWATEGNTELIPNSKLDGLLTQILAGTNITIDDSTAGEITITSSGGTGNITRIITAGTSGLSGGTASGDATLSLDFTRLTPFSGGNLVAGSDLFVLRDSNGGNAPYRTVTKNTLANALSDGTTLNVNNDAIRIANGGVDTTQLADESVTEDKLDIGNAPTLSQLLSWDGSGLLWATSTGSGSSTFLT